MTLGLYVIARRNDEAICWELCDVQYKQYEQHFEAGDEQVLHPEDEGIEKKRDKVFQVGKSGDFVEKWEGDEGKEEEGQQSELNH